ncbi:MAG TPA: PAS domain S-box protein, partial [Fibrobacteria bacterium]|nr:PAS domain S-box protein [Fibrobacteria bacterium]
MAKKVKARDKQDDRHVLESTPPAELSGDWRPAGDVEGNEERLHLLALSEAHEAIFLLDDKGCIRFWSRGAALLFGYNRDDMNGRDVTGLLAGEIPEALRPAASRDEAGGADEGSCTVVSVGLRKDG